MLASREFGPAGLSEAIELDHDPQDPENTELVLPLETDEGRALTIRLNSETIRTLSAFFAAATERFPNVFRVH
jgi:hypothetical protein